METAILVSVGAGVAGAGIYFAWPRDPRFEVVGMNIAGLSVRFSSENTLLPVAVVDSKITISIRVTNENWVGIQYGETNMDIFYKDTLLGNAKVPAGKQGRRSEEMLEVTAVINGLQVTNHVLDLIEDVRIRKMSMRSLVTISGDAKVAFVVRHPFKCHVESDIVVDPVLLNVIEQDNRVHMELGLKPKLDLSLEDNKNDNESNEVADVAA